MAMVPCPGCGLPRASSEVQNPCPVCASETASHATTAPKTDAPADAFTSLPKDTTQLEAASSHRGRGHRPEIVTAILGIAFGAGMVLAISPYFEASRAPQPSPDVTNRTLTGLASPASSAAVPAVPLDFSAILAELPAHIAPVPRAAEASSLLIAPEPREVPGSAVRPALVVTIDIDQPNGSFVLSKSDLFPNQTVILRGRVKRFRTYTQPGITIDASQLVAEEIYIAGYVLGKSVLKLNAPKGLVTFAGGILGQSRVEVMAVEGQVYFSSSGPNITDGSTLIVKAAKLRCKGDIAGQKTHLDVTLSNGGSITAKAILGPVRLDYRKTTPQDLRPTLDFLTLDPRATIQRVD